MKGRKYILLLIFSISIHFNIFSIEKKKSVSLNSFHNSSQCTYAILNGINNALNNFFKDFNHLKIKGLIINSKIVKDSKEFKTKVRFKKIVIVSIVFLLVMIVTGYIYAVIKRRKKENGEDSHSEIELNDEKCNLTKERVEKENQGLSINNKPKWISDSLTNPKGKITTLADSSHKEQIPVDGIIGLSEHILETSDLDEEIRTGYLDGINKNGCILIDLIENIVALSKIETKQLKLIYSECKLNEILDQLHSFFEVKCVTGKKDIEIIVEKEFDDSDFVIYSDGKRIKQVLYYLLNNALKFTNEGNIKFGYYIEIPNIVFYVMDTGTSLSNAEKEIVFERFEEYDKKANRKFGDTSLDLTISKGIVENLDGKIWVESNNTDKQAQENSGSIFYFTIPYQGVSRNISMSYNKTDYKEFKWPDKTILIVEDAIISYELLTKFLKDSQVNFLHATDGKQAVDLCKNNDRIDLVLMDIQLPIMDGLEATGLIKSYNPELPIIAQTANAMEEDKPNIIAAGCDDYISKPINRLELLQKINTFLNPN